MSHRTKRPASQISAASPSSAAAARNLDEWAHGRTRINEQRCGKCTGCRRTKDCGNCVACLNNRVAKKKTCELDIPLYPCSLRYCKQKISSRSRQQTLLVADDGKQETAHPPSENAASASEMERLKRSALDSGVSPENFDNWRVLSKFDPLAYLKLKGNWANEANATNSNEHETSTIHDPFGLKIPDPPVENICSSCFMRTDGEHDEREPILLCDGCDREYHLRCLQPRYSCVPDGDFYCWDCSTTGTTFSLQSYLKQVDRQRANYPTRAAYVASLRDNLIKAFHKNMAGRKPSKFNMQDYQIPSSELDLEHIQRIESAIHSSERDSSSSPRHETSAEASVAPDFLIGKPVDLFFNDPKEGDRLHSGRIVDCRQTDDAGVEYLVRFPAGADYRKTHVSAWISLEEHVITVETSLIWIEEKKGQWIPAIVQLRSVLSLIMLLRTQAIPEPESPPRHSYRTTAAKRERISAWTKTFGDRPGLIDRDMKSQAMPFVPKESGKLSQLAAVEWHEQQRVRQWWNMKLIDPYGYRALTSRDEYELEPLTLCGEKNNLKTHAELCPLVPRGLDRMHIVRLLHGNSSGRVEPMTRDVASTLSVKIVGMSSSLFSK